METWTKCDGYKKFIDWAISSQAKIRDLQNHIYAGVTELVDGRDLGSCAIIVCGFDPHLPYQLYFIYIHGDPEKEGSTTIEKVAR